MVSGALISRFPAGMVPPSPGCPRSSATRVEGGGWGLEGRGGSSIARNGLWELPFWRLMTEAATGWEEEAEEKEGERKTEGDRETGKKNTQ